jgi:hypothetical protein
LYDEKILGAKPRIPCYPVNIFVSKADAKLSGYSKQDLFSSKQNLSDEVVPLNIPVP